MKCLYSKRGDLDIERCLDGKGEVTYVARRGRDEVAWGSAEVYGKHYLVTGIQVDDKALRSGIGTKLYEQFASDACAVGLPLASDTLRSHFAEAFWRKQEAKGRVVCQPGRGEVYKGPVASLKRQLREGKISQEEFDKRTKGLPVSPDGNYWPCASFEITRPCSHERLDGLKKRGRRASKRR